MPKALAVKKGGVYVGSATATLKIKKGGIYMDAASPTVKIKAAGVWDTVSPTVIEPVKPLKFFLKNVLTPRIDARDPCIYVCEVGEWEGFPRPVFSFQWFRNGLPIQHATGKSYTIQPEDYGTALTCDVSASNPFTTLTLPTLKATPV